MGWGFKAALLWQHASGLFGIELIDPYTECLLCNRYFMYTGFFILHFVDDQDENDRG